MYSLGCNHRNSFLTKFKLNSTFVPPYRCSPGARLLLVVATDNTTYCKSFNAVSLESATKKCVVQIFSNKLFSMIWCPKSFVSILDLLKSTFCGTILKFYVYQTLNYFPFSFLCKTTSMFDSVVLHQNKQMKKVWFIFIKCIEGTTFVSFSWLLKNQLLIVW